MDLILGAGPVVKLVLAILVYFSIVSWAIIFYKLLVVQRATKASMLIGTSPMARWWK